MLAVVATAFSGLIVPTPTVQQFVVPAAAPPVSQASQALLFPTTDVLAAAITSIDDELEKAAQAQLAADAKIEAAVRTLPLLWPM